MIQGTIVKCGSLRVHQWPTVLDYEIAAAEAFISIDTDLLRNTRPLLKLYTYYLIQSDGLFTRNC
jgi:hypothetical protein